MSAAALPARIAATLRTLRDQEADTFLLSIARVGFGLLFVNEAWLATQQLRNPAFGFFGDYFHQPFLPEALVPSEGAYEALVVAQWVAGALIVVGRGARPALLVAAGSLVYTMLCDRLWFHHYRHTMAAFGTLLAFAPCDRHLVLGRAARSEAAPIWAQHAMKAQVSVMYLASGGSKLLDADWRGGLMMRGMVAGFARLVRDRGVPPEIVGALQTPLGASLLAKGAISTELALAVLLWWPRTRRLGLWIGLFFHLYISLMTPVQLFTAEMLLVYLLFATPDSGGRIIRYDPKRHAIVNVIEGLDWLRRFKLEPKGGASLVVVDRGGEEQRGLRAAATVFGALPVPFVVWPAVALLSRLPLRRGSPRRAP
ncbi:MAG TPA: HTTM domain-containing protein [Polyangiaceae bacterium]